MKYFLRNKKLRTAIFDYFLIIIGCFITAMAFNIFLIPFRIAPGGLTGIATVVFHLTSGKFPVGVMILIMNIPLFLLGIKYIGGKFFVKSIISTLLLSVFIDASEPFTYRFVEDYLGDTNNLTSNANLLLFCIVGGVLTGVGIGLVFRAGSTTGGTDLAARIVHKFAGGFSVGQVLLLVDGIVVVFASIAFRSFLLGLYAVVTIFITTKVVDAVLEGINYSKAVFIISDYSDDIAQRILVDINRGVTGLSGEGMYTKQDKKILMCVMDRGQITKLKQIVTEIDKDAFVVVSDVREVVGEGF